MSDPVSDADKIRNKRLAKLGSSGATDAPAEQSKAPAPSAELASDQPAPVRVGSGPSSPAVPDAHLAMQSKPSATPPPSNNAKQEKPGHARQTSQSRSRNPVTTEQWVDRTLSSFFRISLTQDDGGGRDSLGNRLHSLPGLRADLEEEGAPLLLSTALLDQALIEAVSKNEFHAGPLDYLIGCWKRIIRFQRNSRNNKIEAAREHCVKEARRICVSYCIFVISTPELFDLAPHDSNPLIPHLLADPEGERGLDFDLLSEFAARFEDDESMKGALVSGMEAVSRSLAEKSMNDDYKPYVRALQSLLRIPSIVLALSESQYFINHEVAAQDIEKQTFLGPFFRLSPLQGDVALNYFSSPKTRDRGYILNSQHALRLTLQQHQDDLFAITDRFVKVSKESRERILDWLAQCMNKNHKRRAMRTDENFVSSDGFMVNVTVCLDKLCEPFMDASFSKVHRIEVEYLRRSPRVDISDETKINVDQPTSDDFYSKKQEGNDNFISECFFLTAAAHHYGTEAANTKLDQLRRHLKWMDKQLEKFEAERAKYVNGAPHILALFDARLKKFKDQNEQGHCVLMATEGVLLDEQLQRRAMVFMQYVIVFLMRLVAPQVDFPRQAPQLPLPSEQPLVFKCLPEYFLEDIVDLFKFVTSHMPQIIIPTQCDELVTICITFLRSSEYIKNPYLKSSLVTILYYGTLRMGTFTNGILGNVLNSLPFALNHLLHALMQQYIECEVTGAHTQFYDKFNIRYEVFQVIKCIWGNVTYREQLEAESRINPQFFVRFVNLLLNDVTFVLDESFTAFNEITSLTRELRANESQMDEETKNQKHEALESAQNKAKSYMSLTNEIIAMLKLFTDALAQQFTSPEIVQRLADMLDFNLDAMVGPKQRNLRVENKDEYRFNPGQLLNDIVTVYLNLAGQTSFHYAVARDGRSYKPSNFEQAANTLKKLGFMTEDIDVKWRKLCEQIAKAKAADEAEAEDLGVIPDEFADPLMGDLMSDPVTLPSSKAIVDRSTIQSILLNDGLDPFNRAPLTIDDVIPATDLKQKIEAWKAEKRQARQQSQPQPLGTEDVMDTTS